jgi:hypothetical protein
MIGVATRARFEMVEFTKRMGVSIVAVMALLTPAAYLGSAGAETPAQIGGSIVGDDGRPVTGANVVVRWPGNVQNGVSTGPNGRFAILGPGDGEAWIFIDAPGYAPCSVSMEVGPSDAILASANLHDNVSSFSGPATRRNRTGASCGFHASNQAASMGKYFVH